MTKNPFTVEEEMLATEILDNVFDEFGQLKLTYGFCSENLRKLIKKNIYPPLDQHAGHEIKKMENIYVKDWVLLLILMFLMFLVYLLRGLLFQT